MNTFIVIPAYNESKKIREVMVSLKNGGYSQIVVVDDGSEDNTFELAKSEEVDVLRHLINLGQGAALKTGIDYVLQKGADIIITFDADGQHSVEYLEQLVKPIKEKKVDIVLGSRFLSKKTKIPFIRKLFLKGGAFLFWLLYGISLTDSHNGLRAFSRRAAEKIRIKSNGMEHASEIVEEIKRNNLKYMEVPVKISYTNYSLEHGQSNLAAFNILYKMIIKKFLT